MSESKNGIKRQGDKLTGIRYNENFALFGENNRKAVEMDVGVDMGLVMMT